MKSMPVKNIYFFTFIFLFFSECISAYPIDGFAYTGIRRLVYEFRNVNDSTRTSKLKPGARKSTDEIQLNLDHLRTSDYELPAVNPAFQKEISSFFSRLEKDYSISVLDITDGRDWRYAEHRPLSGYQPGSVGKLAVLLGFFTELQRVYGNDWEAKRALMSTKTVWSGKWGVPNSHTVPFYNISKDRLEKRLVVPSDNFTLYEWLDHMLSVSSNSAATIVWREAVLLRLLGEEYECSTGTERHELWKELSKDSLSRVAVDIVNSPLRRLGISEDEWRLGSFFTSGADQYIPGRGGSIGTTRGLMKFMLALEKGQLINTRSSLEMKRLMYITDRRIRYASARVLDDAKVYFKSGSFYKCNRSLDASCGKYRGNVYNYMNSVALVEHDDCSVYIVVLMSNVLSKNSANEHFGLASRIDALIRHTEEG